MKTAIAAVALVFVAACAGGGGGGGGGGPGPALVIEIDGGSAEIVAGTTGKLKAAFITSSTAGPKSYRLADDRCLELAPGGGPSTSSPVEAGTKVSWSTSAGTVVLDAPKIGIGIYGATNVNAAADAEWTITNAGGTDLPAQTIGVIRTPRTLIVNASTLPPVVAGQPLILDFTPDTGATFVEIRLVGQSKDYRCNAVDDGIFVVPADVTQAVGDNAIYSIIPTTLAKVSVDGRDFLLRASSP